MSSVSKAASNTFLYLNLPFCLVPILTAGIPKNDPSLIAEDEFPIKHLVFFINGIYCSIGKFLTIFVFFNKPFSLKILICLEISSEPASELGHIIIFFLFSLTIAFNIH